MAGITEKKWNAREGCQALGEKEGMPGKDARHWVKKKECQGRMPGIG
ncbi:hypothetical protein [Metabacillus sp. FJAT-52054]|uniref:Uncharacterized protein n=1 Tax=Metabacillus sediminis TaxID=3117746 RepID=A0ABZ2NLS8_9BACI